MTYFQLVAAAPPGAAHFSRADLERFPPELLERHLERVPETERRLFAAGDPAATARLLRALFWPLVYHLEPSRWDELSRSEPIHPAILEALPADGARVLEIGAGTGRLTAHLVTRARTLIAVEPVPGLRVILSSRIPGIAVLDAFAEDLPLVAGWADLTVSCASLGPDPAILAELVRCTRRGGTLALVSPEQPEWFEQHGWKRITFDAAEVQLPPHDPALEAFFGPLDPPHELVLRAL